MTLLEAIRDAFAIGGMGLAAWTLYLWLRKYLSGDEAPIRVKGGSIEILNRVGDWDEDLEEKDREFQTAGGFQGWTARIWKNSLDWEKGEAAAVTLSGRRIIVKVAVPLANDYQVVFRPNGGFRVHDEEKALVLDGNVLKNDTANHRIKAVIAKTRGKKPEEYREFNDTNKGHIELWPTK